MRNIYVNIGCWLLFFSVISEVAADDYVQLPPKNSHSVTFQISNIHSAGELTLALFNEHSPEFSQQYKKIDKADQRCHKTVSGKNTVESLTCELDGTIYSGVAFVDTDFNMTLTHRFGIPVEQYGFTGVGRVVLFPPKPEQSVIDTAQNRVFTIQLR